MTRYLRSHSLLTILVSSTLIVAGWCAVYLRDAADLSGTAMMIGFIGFIAFCVGIVGLMIVVFRPIPLTGAAAMDWETRRVAGKSRFVRSFLLGASPILLGIMVPVVWNEDFEPPANSILKIVLVGLGLLGITAVAGSELWKHFERERSAASDEPSPAENKRHEH